jgi:IS1 family transposase
MSSAPVQTLIQTNVQNTVKQKVTEVATQVTPAYALVALPKYKAKPLTTENSVLRNWLQRLNCKTLVC